MRILIWTDFRSSSARQDFDENNSRSNAKDLQDLHSEKGFWRGNVDGENCQSMGFTTKYFGILGEV